MKKEIGILLLLFIIPSQRVFTQLDFKFGPVSGLSMTSKPHSQYLNPELKIIHRVHHYIGCTGLLSSNKKFFFTSGLLYEISGYSYKIEWDTGSETEGIVFQKLCFPITAGFSFKHLALSPSVYIGYRPNVLLSGKIEDVISSHNLFASGTTTQRYVSQFILGLSAEPIKNLEVNLSCIIGRQQEYTIDVWEKDVLGHMHFNTYQRSFNFNGFSFGLSYWFKLKSAKELRVKP